MKRLALFEWKIGKTTLAILPLVAVKQAAIAGALVLCALTAVDRIFLPGLEDRRELSAVHWKQEGEKMISNLSRRNEASWGKDETFRPRGEHVSPNKKTARRIMIIGDSFVWGGADSNVNDLWWRQLDRELKRRGYRDVEIVAAGWSGYSTRQELEMARRLVPRYHPDLIVWGYVTNDADEKLIECCIASPPGPAFAERLGFWPEVQFMIGERAGTKTRQREQDTGEGNTYEEWELQMLRGENFKRYRQTVREVGAYVHSLSIPCFFVTLPNHPDTKYFQPRYAPVAPLFRAQKIAWFDLLPDFVKTYPEGKVRGSIYQWGANPADGHPGRKSTMFFARSVADILERRYPDALAKKSTPVFATTPRVNDWVPAHIYLVPIKGGVEITYPNTPLNMLTIPGGDPYVQLNFAEAVRLRSVTVQGAGLASARIRLVPTSADGTYGEIYDCGWQSGAKVQWALPAQPFGAQTVEKLMIEARFTGENQRLSVVFTP